MARLAALLFASAMALAPCGAESAPAAKHAPAAKPAAAAKAVPPRAAPASKGAPPGVVAPEEDALPAVSWSAEDGPRSAATVTGRCLEGPRPETCAHLAFLQCQRAHGSQDPKDMNDCADYARAGWDDRLGAGMDRLQQIMDQTARTKPAPRALVASQKKWRAWSLADCEIQTEATRGGALHPMDVDLCLSGHAAARALELEQLASIWGRR
jgi:uncharacterized protein YecT (DUF1311 family)